MVVPLPPTPSPGPRRVPEGLRLALAAALAATLVLVVLVVLTQRGGDDGSAETASDGLASTSDGPGSTLDGETPGNSSGDPTDDPANDPANDPGEGPAGGCPEGTIVEVCDAVAFIERFKGDRPFKTFPTVNFIDDATFDEFVLADFAEAEEELRDTGATLQSLGLIDADVDLVEALRTTLELGVAGAYNTETNELNVNGTEVNLYTQMVMVHELTHAWDDQYFELSRPEYDDADGEIASGFLNVVEGSATLTENAWRATLTPEQQAELEALELGAISPEDMDLLFTVPIFVLQLQISPYVDGAAFVEQVFEAEGLDGVDALFDSPPTTTEQVFDVEAYRTDEAAVPLPDIVAEGTEFDRGVLGQLVFNLWLGADVGDGWGGDEYVSWRNGEQVCTTIHVVGDTDTDTDEFRTALEAWAADDGTSRTVETVDGTIAATGCR